MESNSHGISEIQDTFQAEERRRKMGKREMGKLRASHSHFKSEVLKKETRLGDQIEQIAVG